MKKKALQFDSTNDYNYYRKFEVHSLSRIIHTICIWSFIMLLSYEFINDRVVKYSAFLIGAVFCIILVIAYHYFFDWIGRWIRLGKDQFGIRVHINGIEIPGYQISYLFEHLDSVHFHQKFMNYGYIIFKPKPIYKLSNYKIRWNWILLKKESNENKPLKIRMKYVNDILTFIEAIQYYNVKTSYSYNNTTVQSIEKGNKLSIKSNNYDSLDQFNSKKERRAWLMVNLFAFPVLIGSYILLRNMEILIIIICGLLAWRQINDKIDANEEVGKIDIEKISPR